MKNKAIFLDRDGTINIDPGYISDPDLIKLYPGVVEGIKLLKNKFGFKIIVISNQSGITRGILTSEIVDSVNNRINQILFEEETQIDAFYYCPFHPEFDSKENCKCRKPSPEMVFKAVDDFGINLSQSFFMGDRESDILCAHNAGVRSILIGNTMTKPKIIELHNSQNSPNFICYNFLDAVEYIESKFDGEVFEN